MPKIDLDRSKLVGFRLLPEDRALDTETAVALGAKMGKAELKERTTKAAKAEAR